MAKEVDIKTLVLDIRKQRESLERREKSLDKLKEDLILALERASSMTREEAKKLLLERIQSEITSEVAKRIKNAEERVRQEVNDRAREILADAMRHGATNFVAEYTVTSVRVPDEETKGRIIGREGRNIRAFERATGVEIELDETDEIRLSSFDSIRREIARRALAELIKDKRIQPSRIEEVVAQQKASLEDYLLEEGTRIAGECGVYNLPNDILKLIGRFKFRTSYGQNLAIHTIEETKMGVSIANEIGAETETVRLGCLLHDIGKVVTEEEGTHVEVGVKVLKKYGFPREVINCVAEHHEDKPFSSVESVVVWISDAISGSRPGARYEPHEDYIKRMEKIEEIVKTFDGISEVYAFQAGRDVRVVVDPDEVDDDRLTVLVREITKKLEREATYAGQIKVVAIRETRATSTTGAK